MVKKLSISKLYENISMLGVAGLDQGIDLNERSKLFELLGNITEEKKMGIEF
jgi:hypothetical protein